MCVYVSCLAVHSDAIVTILYLSTENVYLCIVCLPAQAVVVNVGVAKCLTASAFHCHSTLVSSVQRLIFPLSSPLLHLMCVSVLFMFLLGEKNMPTLLEGA